MTTSRRIPLAVGLVILVALPCSAPAQGSPPGYVRLSNERTRSWSAQVQRNTWVRKRPHRRARKVARLRTHTFHGSPERVLVLGEVGLNDRFWFHVRYPGLGSRRGWVPDSALSPLRRHRERMVLDRRRLRVSLWRGKRLLFRTPVGVGAFGSPTPGGRFYIRERIGPFANTNSVYGALAFGTSSYSPYRTDWPGGGQVGIHGTNQPSLIPGRISNGCVRLHNSAVLRLGRRLGTGTPLLVK